MTMQFNEPWHECDEGKCGCGQILGPESTYITSVEKPDVRRRIVACVNFCAGISTENLEGNEKLLWLAEQYNEVKSQRDALSLALEEARTGLVWYQDHCPSDANGSDDEALARIDAALELTKGAL